MVTADSFLTHSLSQYPSVRRVLAAAVNAVEPGEAVRKHVRREGDQLFIDGRNYTFSDLRRIHVLSLGKAAHAMASALSGLLAGLPFHGLIIPKHSSISPEGFDQCIGGHPVPNADSLKAGQRALDFISNVQQDDLVICLISGGGSALMTAPIAGVELDDMQRLTKSLLKCGARVDEINTLRRHLDQLKGGGIARIVHPARVVSLILSDVVGDPLEAIASGPTAPDPSSREDALKVIHKYALMDQVPPSILSALQETPKPGDGIFERVQNILVGSNSQAAQAARAAATKEGFEATILQEHLQGEAREAAEVICRQFKESMKTTPRPLCLIAGGETTVTVRGEGRGGRNQEFALACVEEISGPDNAMIVAMASDGEDGPTDAAGAVVTGETYARGNSINLAPQGFLQENDSYNYFAQLDDLIKPGPTGTNVNDLILCFGF